MERGIANSALILSDNQIWHTPHVVQRARRGELRWDDLLRLLVQDLAFGMSQVKWVPELLHEGNIGLARELAQRLGIESSTDLRIDDQENEWQQMVEVIKAEAAKYVSEHSDELRESEVEDYEESLSGASAYIRLVAE